MTIRESKPPNPERPQPRFAPGPLGRGVYLSDLVRWLMEKHEDVRTRTVKEKLCPVLLAERPQLYLVQKSGEATPLPDGQVWSSTESGNLEVLRIVRHREVYRVDGRQVTQRGSEYKTTEYTPKIGQGLDGAVQWLLTYWGNSGTADAIMDNDTRASWLAVSEADARRCWGWRGADEAQPAVDAVAKAADDLPKLPTTWAELVPYHKANPGHAWTVDLKNIVSNEKIRRSNAQHKGVAKAMAAELAVTESMVNQLIAKKDEIGSRVKTANRRTGTR